MVRQIVQVLILGFVLFSSYAHSFFRLSVPVLGRLTPADLFGLVAVFLSPFLLKKIKAPRLFLAYFILLITFGIGVFVSQNLQATMIEIGILAYLGLLFLLFSNSHFSTQDFRRIVMVFTWSTIIACIIGLWDLSTVSTGLPRILHLGAAKRLPSGTFRNGGQAGAYMLVAIAIIFPILISDLRRFFSRRQYSLMVMATTLAVLTIFANAKMAAIIGVIIGMVFYLISKRKFSMLIPLSFLGFLMIGVFNYLVQTESRISGRLRYKYRTRIVSLLDSNSGQTSKAESWMEENYGAAINTFLQYPLTGSGIGGFQKVFHKNEVHSTPLKILGETGLFGLVGYTIFTIAIFVMFSRLSQNRENPFRSYLSNMLPFLLGCYVSWIYTYHLRKREFWVLLFVLYLATYLMKKYDEYLLKKRLNAG